MKESVIPIIQEDDNIKQLYCNEEYYILDNLVFNIKKEIQGIGDFKNLLSGTLTEKYQDWYHLSAKNLVNTTSFVKEFLITASNALKEGK